MSKGGSTFGDNGVLATSDELRALTANMRKNFLADVKSKPVDLHNPDDFINAVNGYLLDCEASGKRPGNLGLYRALGMSKQDVNNVLTGKSKSKLSPDCIDLLKKAIRLMSEYREQLGLQGKLNPVTMIFWQKNYDGLSDTQTLEVVPASQQDASLTPEQIAKQIEKDIPIDGDYKDVN